MLDISHGNCNIILAAIVIPTVASAMKCPSACTCDFYGKDIFCPENDPETHVAYRNAEDFSSLGHNSIEIECFNPKLDETLDYCSIDTLLNKVLLKSNIEGLAKLTFESISQNRTDITISKDAFKSVPNLNILTISYNNIVTFESDFLGNTPNITALALTESGVSEIDNYFRYASKLKYLSLSKNRIKSLPNRAFENLTCLTHLYLDSNNISYLSKYAFSGLIMLQILDLSNNHIGELTDNNFEDLEGLLHINLGHNLLKNIAGNIFYKNPLVIVELVYNSAVILPDYLLANLTSLTTVNLESNKLKEMPVNIFRKCENLSYLSLSKNQMASLPETLFKDLYKLETLDLSENKLESLPNSLFSSTTKLEILNLSNNQISVINKYLFRKLNSLYQIDLRNNKIYLIESQAFNWQDLSLTYLDLSHNKWNASGANNSINHCQRLRQLNLSHNKILGFPYMPALVNMKKMDLSYNQIDYFEIKHVIASLWQPTEYDLSNNRIKNINFDLDKPIGLKHFSRAKIVLNLSQNPIQCGCSIYDLVCYNNGEMKDLSAILDIIQNNLFCPLVHNNTLIETLRPIDVECFVLQGCPSMCKCRFTPYNRALVVDCSFKNLSTYPEMHVKEPSHEQMVLNLSGNLLTKGPLAQECYSKVTSLNLSSNNIVALNWIPSQTKELDLSNNRMQNLNEAFIKTLKSSTSLQWLGLRNNPWTCDCEASDFRDYLIENHNMVELHEVYCENRDAPLVKVSDLCKEVPYLSVLLPVFLTLFLCLTITISLYYRYQTEIKVYLFSINMCLWLVTEEEVDKDKIFDVFISYSHQDEDFVVDELLQQLEQGDKPFRVCIHMRDWIPGELIAQQIIKSVQCSRRTLIVLSNSYLESIWGKMEFRAAHTEALIEGRARVIVLLYGDVDESKLDDELKSYLKTNTYIKWGEKYFWNKLKYALPHLKTNVILRQFDNNLQMKTIGL